MIDLADLAEKVYQNKLDKGFNVTDISLEICNMHSEVAEIWDAYCREPEHVGEEMADVMIYLLGLSKILNIDLERELLSKMEKNSRRVYKVVDGVWTKIENGAEK